MQAMTAGTKLIADNRRARHGYHLLDRIEAGLALTGTEVKSLRDGNVVFQRAFGDVRGDEVYLVGLHIPEYTQGNAANHDRTATASSSSIAARSTSSPPRSRRRALP